MRELTEMRGWGALLLRQDYRNSRTIFKPPATFLRRRRCVIICWMTNADLSNFHKPVLPSFFDGTDSRPEGLSRQQIDFFHQNGFISGVPVLSYRQLGLLRDELALLMDPSLPPNPRFYEFHR